MGKEPSLAFLDRSYFECDDQKRGYRGEGYRDFTENLISAQEILKRKPTSFLDLGGARGYVAKKVAAAGVHPSIVLDKSLHCYYTRAVDSFYVWDITSVPYPLDSKSIDMVFSNSVLEHIPEDELDSVIVESARVSRRGFHGICCKGVHGDEKQFYEDGTHETYQDLEWWKNKFATLCPGYDVEISADIAQVITESNPLTIPGEELRSDGQLAKKINLGSFIGMFHYGWLNIDSLDLADFAEKQHYGFMQHDVKQGLPFPDEYADLVFSSHMWEHLSRSEGMFVAREVYRILKRGGVFRVAVPDARFIMSKYLEGNTKDWEHFSAAVSEDTLPLDDTAALLLDNHKYVYDSVNLGYVLEYAGFKDISVKTPFSSSNDIMENQTIVSHPAISLVMEGIK